MNRWSVLFLALLFVFPLHTQAAESGKCSASVSSKASDPKGEIEYLDDQVAIVYYGRQNHVEFLVEDNMYNMIGRASLTTKRGRLFIRTTKGQKLGVYKAAIRVTHEELSRIKELVAEYAKRPELHTCASGACAVLTEATGMKFPPIIRDMPGMLTVFLRLKKALGDSRITSIEYTGRFPMLSNLLNTIAIPSDVGLMVWWYPLKGLDYSLRFITKVVRHVKGKPITEEVQIEVQPFTTDEPKTQKSDDQTDR